MSTTCTPAEPAQTVTVTCGFATYEEAAACLSAASVLTDLKSVLTDFDRELRSIVKHGSDADRISTMPSVTPQAMSELRSELLHRLSEAGINLYE